MDVDIALDAAKLNDGRYAELVQLLLDTKRYRRGAKDFQLVVAVGRHRNSMRFAIDSTVIGLSLARQLLL